MPALQSIETLAQESCFMESINATRAKKETFIPEESIMLRSAGIVLASSGSDLAVSSGRMVVADKFSKVAFIYSIGGITCC